MSKGFVFGNTRVAQTAQEIREHESQPTETSGNTIADPQEDDATKAVVVEKPTSEAQEQTSVVRGQTPVTQEQTPANTPTDTLATKSKKTENGIVVNVPMDDYMQLTMMKFQTGRTLKDLALQAIHEFVIRNK